MLALRIIPAIDIMDGKVVRLLRGDPKDKTIYYNDPIRIAKQWESQGAHMLHVVDLDATLSLGDNTDIIQDMANTISVPIQVAGGRRSEDLVHDTLQYADRVVVGTLALDTKVLHKLIQRYDDRLVVSLDHNDGHIMSHGWQQTTNNMIIPTMKSLVALGVTQFLVTNISRDGTLSGPDIQTLSKACRISNVIASGGVSGVSDVRDVAKLSPYGIILGKALYEGLITIPEALEC